MASIIREQTDEEKRDFKLLGEKNKYAENFMKALKEKRQEHTKDHTPFCYRCAKLDFEKKVNNVIQEAALRNPVSQEASNIINFKAPDLKDYADKKRFKVGKIQDALDRPRGIMTSEQMKIGEHHDFICKERGCGISVYIPNSELKKATPAA